MNQVTETQISLKMSEEDQQKFTICSDCKYCFEAGAEIDGQEVQDYFCSKSTLDSCDFVTGQELHKLNTESLCCNRNTSGSCGNFARKTDEAR